MGRKLPLVVLQCTLHSIPRLVASDYLSVCSMGMNANLGLIYVEYRINSGILCPGGHNRWTNQACRNSVYRSHSHIKLGNGHIIPTRAAQYRLLLALGCDWHFGAVVNIETEVSAHA